MPRNHCHHITATGALCRGIPMGKRDYCYWHLHENGRRMKAARARARRERVIMQLPVLDDLHAVQVSLMQLGEAVAYGEIDDRRGRLLLAVLRLAASNIKAQGTWLDEAQMHDDDDASYVSDSAGFEQQYGLPKGLDLSLAPDIAFPPPEEKTPRGPHIPSVGICGDDNDVRARFSQALRNAATPIPGTDFQVTADDMELMEVYERQGEQAGLQRATVLERNRKRRERREQRIRFEEMARNRNLQLAAEKLLLQQQRSADPAPKVASDAGTSRRPPKSEGTSPATSSAQSPGS
jgi:hypothetical protein